MKRYNIDTQNGDLIQIDLNDSWTIQENEEALLNLVRFEGPETKKRYATVIVTKNDLINLRDNLNKILDKSMGWDNFLVGDFVKSEGKKYVVVGLDPKNTAHLQVKDDQGKIWSIHNCLCEHLKINDQK